MQIYYAYLSDFTDEAIDCFSEYIPLEIRERLSSVKNIRAKKESTLAWYLLYKALSERGTEGFSVTFGENKKPYLKDIPLFFNLTHSDGLVCCAVGESEVGIDAEKIKSVKDSLINKVLTENERATLNNKDSDFIRYWTLKESLLKYKGSGITEELYSLDFSSFSGKTEFYFEDLLFTVRETDGYFISVCSEEKERDFIRLNA